MAAPESTGTTKPAREIIEIEPHRLAWGVWDHKAQKQFGKGDIRASYSGERIGMDQPIRRPFMLRGSLWITTGFGGIGGDTAEVYRLVDPSVFAGKPTTYREKTRDAEAARNDPLGFYHGMAVRCGKATLILCGPPVLLTPSSTEQLGLFEADPSEA
ncbi:MAG: hypothetical protein H6812_04590 [Phycisphaeraceae bacterium]|nr:hypothetical protein [Phycisphaerales bacterium]MCB9842516.1 hypothetical protein [Phycisphaeraceae bacterium]